MIGVRSSLRSTVTVCKVIGRDGAAISGSVAPVNSLKGIWFFKGRGPEACRCKGQWDRVPVKDARRQARGRGSRAKLPLGSCLSRHAGRSEWRGKMCWLTPAIKSGGESDLRISDGNTDR